MQGKVKANAKEATVLIGELAQASGTTTKTLRFYEANALLPTAERTASGYRDFPRETVARLDFIRRGQSAGLTLAQIREILDIRDAGRAPCQHVHDLLAHRLADLDTQIADLQALRATVRHIHDSVSTAGHETSDAEQVCPYL